MSDLAYDIVKRKFEYIRLANKEIIKSFAEKDFSPEIIAGCNNIIRIKPRVVVADAKIIPISPIPPDDVA